MGKKNYIYMYMYIYIYIYIYMIMYIIYRGVNIPFELLLKKKCPTTKINFFLNRITQPSFYKYVYSSMFKE